MFVYAVTQTCVLSAHCLPGTVLDTERYTCARTLTCSHTHTQTHDGTIAMNRRIGGWPRGRSRRLLIFVPSD